MAVVLAVLLLRLLSLSCQPRLAHSLHSKQIPFLAHHHIPTLSWAVKLDVNADLDVDELDRNADALAADIDLIHHGQIGNLRCHHLFSHRLHNESLYYLRIQKEHDASSPAPITESWEYYGLEQNIWQEVESMVHEALDAHPLVAWHTQQVFLPRQKRAITCTDPQYKNQWHLNNQVHPGMDINVLKVWERNITGDGVVASVVDDGLEWTNPDLKDNYLPEASWDLNNNDPDPMPRVDIESNHHGTRCAGEIAAVANSVCAVGVAYKAKISGLKVLDGAMTDSLEASAFTKMMDIVDIYSCSWGPDDDGQTLDGPHYLAQRALQHAVNHGRRGYGSIFVVASGNGGLNFDNCNFDGYATSIYTVTIGKCYYSQASEARGPYSKGVVPDSESRWDKCHKSGKRQGEHWPSYCGAVDETGAMPYYAEECASMLAVSFSSGSGLTRSIVTTDWTKHGASGCTDKHSGTSAAAPLAAGMIALMLQAQPCLTWRDIQHILVMAARKVDVDVAHWYKNAAGLHHSHKHGFGLLDAWKLVNAAKIWKPVPWLISFTTPEMTENVPIPDSKDSLTLAYHVTSEELRGYNLFSLEYVHVTLTASHMRRGDLEIRLRCPSQTESILASTRKKDESDEGFQWWTFGTVRCWGEAPEGTWTLVIKDKGKSEFSRGMFEKWKLRLYGSSMTPEGVKQRIQDVADSANGTFLYDNVTTPCPPAPIHNKLVHPLSEKTLKLLALVSFFCLISAIYETFEYMFCYNDEKKEHREYLKQLAAEKHAQDSSNSHVSAEDATERTGLLAAEEIPLQDSTESTSALLPQQISETSFTEDNWQSSVHSCHDAESSNSRLVTEQSHCIGSESAARLSSTHIDVPHELLASLSPEELRLNLGIGTKYGT